MKKMGSSKIIKTMKHAITQVKNDLIRFDSFERSILIAIAGLFLPFQFAAAVLSAILLYAAIKGNLIRDIKNQKGAIWFYSFCVLELGVSLGHHNWVGLLNVGGFILIGFFVAFYRKHLTPKLFQYVISELIFLSWFAGIYGLFEFQKVSVRKGYAFFDFVVQNSPKDRINSTFMNANFYATIIEFEIVFCLYKFIRTKKMGFRLYYVITAFFNFFMILLTGCRTALLPFLFIFPVFFWFDRKRNWFIVSMIAEMAVLVLVLMFPELIPRFDQLSTLNARFEIWYTALLAFTMHPWFGQGPQTYGFVYKMLKGHKAPHAHNIVLDTLLSYGIFGTLLLIGYAFSLWKEIYRSYKKNKDPAIFAMILCFFVIFFIHGLLDVTMNFLATGCIFMLIINSSKANEKSYVK